MLSIVLPLTLGMSTQLYIIDEPDLHDAEGVIHNQIMHHLSKVPCVLHHDEALLGVVLLRVREEHDEDIDQGGYPGSFERNRIVVSLSRSQPVGRHEVGS